MFGRFKLFGQMWKTGRLALRLARDSRVPMTAKMVLGATLIYLVSPIDAVPDWLPIVGQADDIAILFAGLNLFIKACPRWIVSELSGKIDRDDGTSESSNARAWDGEDRTMRDGTHHSSGQSSWDDAAAGPTRSQRGPTVIEGDYRRVR